LGFTPSLPPQGAGLTPGPPCVQGRGPSPSGGGGGGGGGWAGGGLPPVSLHAGQSEFAVAAPEELSRASHPATAEPRRSARRQTDFFMRLRVGEPATGSAGEGSRRRTAAGRSRHVPTGNVPPGARPATRARYMERRPGVIQTPGRRGVPIGRANRKAC